MLLKSKSRSRDTNGATLVEYVMLISFIALIVVVALRFLGLRVNSTLSNTAASVAGAGN